LRFWNLQMGDDFNIVICRTNLIIFFVLTQQSGMQIFKRIVHEIAMRWKHFLFFPFRWQCCDKAQAYHFNSFLLVKEELTMIINSSHSKKKSRYQCRRCQYKWTEASYMRFHFNLKHKDLRRCINLWNLEIRKTSKIQNIVGDDDLQCSDSYKLQE